MKIRKDIAISDSGFVFNPLSGESYSVNPIGIELFNLIKQEKTYEEIRDLMLEKYDTDEATFEKDYQDFLAIMEQNNLFETEDEL
jgi:hypothetical protein